MKTLAEANRYIDSFKKPEGLNHYSWSAIKKLALLAWECYLENKRFNRTANFLCREFYQMIRDEQGNLIIPQKMAYHDHAL